MGCVLAQVVRANARMRNHYLLGMDTRKIYTMKIRKGNGYVKNDTIELPV